VRIVGGGRGEVRLIGGLWKRSKLPVPDAPGLRPTPERLRETLYNWLGQDLAGWRVLDAFAGSGALGFEAASRGAAEVVLVERDAKLAAGLERSRARLGGASMRVVRDDALAWMRRAAPASFDLVLLDPPFDSALAGPALAASARLVVPEGFVYLETGAPWSDEDLAAAGFSPWRRTRTGAVHAALLRPEAPAKLASDRPLP
jgi:16S rRNA (guanine(966)-N(2))-methyltransferase RsmD